MFKKKFCIICKKQTGTMASFKTGDGNRLCEVCGLKMGFRMMKIDASEVEVTSDADLAARFSRLLAQAQAEPQLQPIRTVNEIVAYYKFYEIELADEELANFQTLVDNLDSSEAIFVPFAGFFKENIDFGMGFLADKTAFAVTNRRLIFAGKARITQTMGSEAFLKIIPLSEITDVAFNAEGTSEVIIATDIGKLIVSVNKRLVAPISRAIKQHLQQFRENLQGNPTPQAQQSAPTDTAEELRKFKQLEIDGIITAEEFEAKKRQLLG